MQPLRNRRVVLGITGGIAAYKSAETARRLMDAGAAVQAVMTRGAAEFVTPLTLQALTGRPVRTDLLDTAAEAAMGHIELARWADLVLVAPATAHFMARLAQGIADDLLTTTCLATAAPIAIAPAMNQQMWKAPATRRNADTLTRDGHLLWGPGEGAQACGDVGPGRMLEPDDLTARVCSMLSEPSDLLRGRHVIITAGPTQEPLDPVRYVSNHSSGKQGFALATAAAEAGARVTLITGPVGLSTPAGVDRVDVTTACEMLDAARTAGAADVLVAVAAVADFRPASVAEQKMKKQAGDDRMTVELVANPDIVATLTAERPDMFAVAFAAETEHLIAHARRKLESKGVDLIVANDVSDRSIGFGSDTNRVTVIDAQGEHALPHATKQDVARALIKLIADRLRARALRHDTVCGTQHAKD